MKLSKSQVNKYNKLADKGKNVMIDTDRYGTVVWEDGDYGYKSIIASDNDGKEIEVDFNNVVRVNEGKIMKLTKSKLKEVIKEVIAETEAEGYDDPAYRATVKQFKGKKASKKEFAQALAMHHDSMNKKKS